MGYRNVNKWRKVLFVILLVLCEFLVTCSKGRNTHDKDYGDWLVIGVTNKLEQINPIQNVSSMSSILSDFIFDGLIKINEAGEIEPNLASSWNWSQEGIIFNLRKNVFFHDGSIFNADDVLYTFNQIFDNEGYSPRRYLLDDIEKVDIVNQNSVLFKMNKKTNSFLPKMDVGILSNINLYNNTEKYFSALPTPNGTGPFRMKVFRNDYAVLESNKDYFHGRPYFNGIVIKVFRDRDEIWSKIMLEEVDTSVLISHGLVDYFQENDNVNLYTFYNPYYYIIAFNMNNINFRSKATRIALNYAINKEEIIYRVFRGSGRLCSGTIFPGIWAYNHKIEPYAYNPKLSKVLLNSEGWVDNDGDEILEKNGEDFSFEILVPKFEGQIEKVAILIQKYFRNIGINVRLRMLEMNEMNNKYLFKKQFDSVLLFMYSGLDPDISYNFWHSTQINNGMNIFSYYNKDVDHYLENGRNALTREEALISYHLMQEAMLEDPPGVYLFWKEEIIPVNRRINGVSFKGPYTFSSISQWWVPKKEQKYKECPE